MKQKLFTFLILSLLAIGQVWGETVDFTGSKLPTNWSGTGSFDSSSNHYKTAAPGYALANGKTLTTAAFSKLTAVTFWGSTSSGGDGKSITIKYSTNNSSWTELTTIKLNKGAMAQKTIDVSSISSLSTVYLQFSSSFNTAYIDDIEITTGSGNTCVCSTAPSWTSNGTAAASDISSIGATLNMSALASQGSGDGCAVTEYGFVYGTGASPALNDAGTAAASGYTKVLIGNSYDAEKLSKAITGLTAGTQYYYKAYAVNCKGKVEANNVQNFHTKVKVSYNKNTSDPVTGDVPADTEIDYNGSHTISSNVLSRTGYDFLGWAESSSATVDQTGTVSSITANKTFYAVWRIKTYDVEWYVNGSLWGGAAVNYNHGASLALPASTPTSSDCDGEKVFVGWTATAGYSNATTAPGDLFTAASGTVTEPKKYYAVFANAAIGTQYTQITATSALEAGGRYLIVGNSSSTYKALPVDKAETLTTVTPTSSKINNPAEELIWTLEKSSSNWKIKSVSNGKYLQISSGNLTFESSTSLTFTASVSSSKFTFTSSASSGNKVLSYYANGSKFNAYTSANNVYLYKANATYSNYSTACSTDPDISVSVTELTGMGYIVGQPVANSEVKNFTVSGRYLTNNIVVSIASDGDYEISESENSGYTNSITLNKNGDGAVTGTKIYVRLKTGNSVGEYNGSNQISVVSSPATTKNVSLSGAVTAKTLTGIAIQTAPTKTDYVIGEYFDPAGLVITATYNSGDETVTYAGNESNFTFTPSLTTTLEGSQTQVQITYGSQSVNQSITMNCPVTWSVNGTPLAAGAYSVVAYGAAVSTLPTNPVSNDCDGAKVFVGWTDTPIDGETNTKPEHLYKPSGTWPNINATTTYYAVFASAGGDPYWSKVTDAADLEDGETYAIISFDDAYYLSTASSSSVQSVNAVTRTDGNINFVDAMKWKAIADGTGFQFQSKASSDVYLWGSTTTGDGIRVNSSSTKNNATKVWYLQSNATYGLILCTINNSTKYYLSTNSTTDWRNYGSTTLSSTNRAANLYRYYAASYSAYATNCNATRYSVTWKNNGVTMVDHGGSTEVVENSRITTMPTTKPTGCGTKEFVGWTDEPIVGVSVGIPAKLYEKPADFPTATGDVIYHAVFADVEGGEDIVLNFPSYNDKGVNSYTSEWTATKDGLTWNIVNYSNNNNGWNYIKTGHGTNAIVGTVTTGAAIPYKIEAVKIKIAATTESKINSAKVLTSSSTDFSGDAGVNIPQSTGWQVCNIASPAANKYYQVKFDCQNYSNGFVQIDEIVYVALIEKSNYVTTCAAMVATPTFSPAAGEYNTQQSVTISTETPDATIYYTMDGSDPKTSGTKQTYSAAIAVSTTTTIKAIAVKGGMDDSYVAEATYTIRKDLNSIEVKTAPKLKYVAGEKLDLTNLEITAHYTVGEDADVAYIGNESMFTLSPAADATLTTENTSLRITYTENTIGKSVDKTINVYSTSYDENLPEGGDVQISGASVTIALAEHYTITSVTATNATITGSAGSYTITNPTGNVTVHVTYAAPRQVYVHYYIGGAEVNELRQTIYAGETATLWKGDDNYVEACDDQFNDFVGWSTSECTNAAVCPALVNGSEVINSETTYHAVYAKLTGAARYNKVTSAPSNWSGQYLIVYEDGASSKLFKASNVADGAGNTVDASVSAGVIMASDAVNAEVWTISARTGGYNIKGKKFITSDADDGNEMDVSASAPSQANSISMGTNGVIVRGKNSYLSYNANRFRYYKPATCGNGEGSGDYKPIQFYKYAAGARSAYQTTCCTQRAITGVSLDGLADSNGNKVKADRVRACEGSVVTLTAIPLSNYVFDSWRVYKTGDEGTTVTVTSNQFTMPAYAVTVEASFTKQVTIHYNGNSKSSGQCPVSGCNVVINAGEEYTILGNTGNFSRSGYTWAGWNTQSNGLGTTYQADDVITPEDNLELYCKWEEIVDTYVDYMHGLSPQTKRGGDYVVPSPEDKNTGAVSCEVEHFKFIGWVLETQLNVDGTPKAGATIVQGGTRKNATGKTYVAIWATELAD